jgi:hypothetical protein
MKEFESIATERKEIAEEMISRVLELSDEWEAPDVERTYAHLMELILCYRFLDSVPANVRDGKPYSGLFMLLRDFERRHAQRPTHIGS